MLRTLFHGCDEYEKGIKWNSRSFCDCLKRETMTLTNLSIFFIFLATLKKITYAWTFFISGCPYIKLIIILENMKMKHEKLSTCNEGTTHKLMKWGSKRVLYQVILPFYHWPCYPLVLSWLWGKNDQGNHKITSKLKTNIFSCRKGFLFTT